MFRILSLDGGGIKGAFAASVLATLEEDTRLAAADHFDLIAGTSTGGIIAIGLGLGIPTREILSFYVERGGTIFPGTSLAQRAGGLLRLGRSEAVKQENLKTVKARFMNGRVAAPFTPTHSLSSDRRS